MNKNQLTEVDMPSLLLRFLSLISGVYGIRDMSLRRHIGENQLTKTEGSLGGACG